jgi:putative addiction module component (TIGR02574 family)
MSSPETSIFDLSVSEKLQLLEDLWDDIASNPTDVPLYAWQKEELERRKQNLFKNPSSALSWGEIQHRIRTRHGH